VFNADEHTGGFGGIRAWLDGFDERIAGVLIGYPGHDRIGVGARGFWRATLHISGASAHSGSSLDRGTNAIAKATLLVESLAELQREMAPSPLRLYSQPVYQHHKM
jgi:succinyl-diaminopimelate desuccinylase